MAFLLTSDDHIVWISGEDDIPLQVLHVNVYDGVDLYHCDITYADKNKSTNMSSEEYFIDIKKALSGDENFTIVIGSKATSKLTIKKTFEGGMLLK